MDNNRKNNLKIIKKANREMLDYFNDSFINELENIQNLKTQIFEVDVKLDELEKTKDIYAFKTSSKKSAFTPVVTDDSGNIKGKIIDNQIKDLEEVRSSLDIKIRMLDSSLKILKRRLELLSGADEAISDLVFELGENIDREDSEDNFEFTREEGQKENENHGYNILMQDAFDKTFYATLLERSVKDGVINLNHKLEMLSYLIGTDTERAKLTIKDILAKSRQIEESVDDINERLNKGQEITKAIWEELNDFIDRQKVKNTGYEIESTLECSDHELVLPPVFAINLFKLLDIFFDNVNKHSGASKIQVSVAVTPNVVNVKIRDNGIGINSEYMTLSPWYSSLHRANEIIYLLGGRLNITGEAMNGTEVTFSFPIQM